MSQPTSTKKTKDNYGVFVVPGMGSDHCAGIIDSSLQRLPGVNTVKTNISNHHVDVYFDDEKTSLEAIKSAIINAGYDVADVKKIEPTSNVRIVVPGMGSNHCAGLVTTSIKRLPGIISINTNISNHGVEVSFTPEQIDIAMIKEVIVDAGYEVAAIDELKNSSFTHVDDDEIEARYLKQAWHRLWIAGIPTTLIMILMALEMFWQPIPGYLAIISLLAFPVVFLYGGWSTHVSAWRSLTNRTANMDVLISMGSLPPYCIGLVGFFYPMTSFIEMASTIMTFHMLGRYLETRAKGRASQAIKKLLKMGAKSATVLIFYRACGIITFELG